jgi:Repeat of unknown function (DUF5648)
MARPRLRWSDALGLVLGLLLGCPGDDAPADEGPQGSGTAGSGSGSSGSSDGETGSSEAGTVDDTGTAPPDCAANEVTCGSVCADLDTDPSNCGQCGRSCVIPQATAACTAGECAMMACEPGWSDCDDMVVTGCETPIDCQEGTLCTSACGSEGAVDCTDVCASAGEPVCLPPAETCNVIDDDCDGACDQGPLPGCRVSVHRSNSPTLGHFYTTNLAEATSGDLVLESQDYFWLYVDVEGLQPLFRCIKGNGKRWLTTSTDCEGTAAPELTMGFISPDDRCGATPLYRLRNVPPDAHFYTTSAAERDNAVNAFGFVDEGIAGYIWAGP